LKLEETFENTWLNEVLTAETFEVVGKNETRGIKVGETVVGTLVTAIEGGELGK